LEQSRGLLEKNGVRIAAISYDSPDVLAAFAEKHGIHYPLLSDAGSAVIRDFGIFNQNMAPDLRSYGVPHPTEYLVSPDGIVIRKYFVDNYQHRVTGSTIALHEFGAVAEDAVTVTLYTAALTVQIGFPSNVAFAGQELGFFANFTLEPGWHVYGNPLPEGYTATAVVFEDPRIERQSFELPPAQMLEIPVLHQTLPVYGGSFAGIGSLLLKFPIPDGPISLAGNLSVQQCSDRICEPPERIPFALDLVLERFVVAEPKKR
jgi:hypothetical protein